MDFMMSLLLRYLPVWGGLLISAGHLASEGNRRLSAALALCNHLGAMAVPGMNNQ
jgi:hypothetical protein